MAKNYDFDYNDMSETHYTVPSWYGKVVREQYDAQPKYCEPGPVGKPTADKRNQQAGP